MSGSSYLLERAVVGGVVRDDVLVEIEDGRFTSVSVGGVPVERFGPLEGVATPIRRMNPRSTGDSCTRIPGLTIPGQANCHSHAFHRALRGRTQRERGTFWTWREQMYDLAGRLDPDSYFLLARAVYREMVAAGMTSVGEFHYLHHQPGGTPYADPNAMGHALLAAAQEAGIRIALLDTCYVEGGFARPVQAAQLRYSDGSADAWAVRTAQLRSSGAVSSGGVVLGAAIHSVRAVPREQLTSVVESAAGGPLHAHVSEQVQENDDCLQAYGVTPTRLLADSGALGPDFSAVHATHLSDDDVRLLGESGSTACFCPTTERDLGDGIGPGRALHEAGARISLGSDSHAVIDPFEEMRALELDERLATQRRGHWTARELLQAGSRHDSLGFHDAGDIAVGKRADLVTIATDTTSTAGTGADEQTAVFAATAADVTQVVVDGRVVVRPGDRADVGRELADVLGRMWP